MCLSSFLAHPAWGTAGILPAGPFFLSFCACLPFFQCSPGCQGLWQRQDKKAPKTNEHPRLPGPSVHTTSWLSHGCMRSEQCQELPQPWVDFVQYSPTQPPVLQPSAKPGLHSHQGKHQPPELGLAHPAHSPRQGFVSMQVVRTPSRAWRTPVEPPALLSPGTAKRPQAAPA